MGFSEIMRVRDEYGDGDAQAGHGACHANYVFAMPTRKNLARYDYDSSPDENNAHNLFELQIERTTDSFSAERINNLILCKVMIPHLTAAPTLT